MRYSWGLDFWKTGEWQVIQEHLRDLDRKKVKWNPARPDLFKPLQAVKPEDVKVVILGQDPYPGRKYCSGHAFSIPAECDVFPPSLCTIFDEYQADLGYPYPTSGSLLPWVEQGVLLWNVYPTCTDQKPLSHHWDEYHYLTWEILDKLSDQSCVIATLGTHARNILRPKDYETFEIISVSHPSPRASIKAKNPFSATFRKGDDGKTYKVSEGCRVFSSINAKLCELSLTPINWRLP
jgi:uracil-DNA glycosylase